MGNRSLLSIYSQNLPFYLGVGMKKSELRDMVREHMRTRFMFEKEDDTTPEQEDGVDKVDPTPAPNGPPSPYEEAIAMGLVDKKFGRFGDPQTGKIVAKIIDGKLTKCEPEDAEETRTAPEPTKSGFNYEDPYGDDYPKPKGQLGAVPPTFAPLPPKPNDVDPYSDAAHMTLGNKNGRPSTFNPNDITSKPEPLVPRRDTLSKDVRDAYSRGGAGTFNGSVPTDGALTRTSSDGKSMTWSKDGPLATPDEDSPERKLAEKTGANLLKKYKSVEKAMEVLTHNRTRVEKEFKRLANHNTNSSEERLNKLKDMQKVIDRLRWAEEAIMKAKQGLHETKLISKGWGRWADPRTGKIVRYDK